MKRAKELSFRLLATFASEENSLSNFPKFPSIEEAADRIYFMPQVTEISVISFIHEISFNSVPVSGSADK